MAQMSAFEVLGPVMVGPSSSHTAGALRCAQVAASLVEGRVAQVRFTLHNSFAHTYRGHGTDRALVAGVLGLATDDERIRDAFALAEEAGLAFDFACAPDNPALHPNTVDIAMEDAAGAVTTVRGESLGGGRVRVSRINGVAVDISGEYDTLFVAHRDVPGVLAELTVLLSKMRVNIAFMRTYRTERGGNAYTVFEMDQAPAPELLEILRLRENIRTATFVRVPGAAPVAPGVTSPAGDVRFKTGGELLALCRERGAGIGAVMRCREEGLSGAARAAEKMARVIQVMREETTTPVEHPQKSLGGLIGGEARQVARAGAQWAGALMGGVQTDAVARAMAVLERSATMGVIVAAPTAGSSGVVPGCALAVSEALRASRPADGRADEGAAACGDDGGAPAGEKDGAAADAGDAALADALYNAAAVGLLLSTNASVSGAEGGCQAEVGSASAMAASALVELLGGTPEQSLDAASLALGNLLGLVCDPVGGLVEVPCQARNAIGVANAFSAAQLALSGVAPLVPFDEAAHAMREVGRALPAALRETAQGGLAVEPAACRACGRCG